MIFHLCFVGPHSFKAFYFICSDIMKHFQFVYLLDSSLYSFLSLQWEDMRVLGTAFLPGHRSMNPCPVYDEFTGTLFLFFIAVLGHTSESYQLVTGKNVTRLCYICSTDDGDTWSPVTDLTKRVIGDTIKGQFLFLIITNTEGCLFRGERHDFTQQSVFTDEKKL